MRTLWAALVAALLVVGAVAPQALAVDMLQDGSNATLPTARNNILHTPPVCDGYYNTNGTAVVSDNTFTVGNSVFSSPGDVNKLISIEKAGSKYFLDSATVSSGGSGWSVGDLAIFDYATDVKLFITSVSGTAVTGFYIVDKGSATVASPANNITSTSRLPTGSSIATSPSANTSLVITPSWVRENLVTTIASVNSATSVELTTAPSADVTPAKWGFGTDYQSTINSALSSDYPVRLPSGICGHSASLALTTGDVLLGQGRGTKDGSATTASTTLMWLGTPNTPQVTLGSEAGTRQSYIQVGNFALEGLGSASKGYFARGISSSHFFETYFQGHTTVGHDVAGNQNSIESIDNRFDHLTFSYDDTGTLNTGCVWWGFPNTYDVATSHDLSVYGQVQCKTKDTIPGFVCGTADHNNIWRFQVRGGGDGGSYSPPGIDMLGSNWSTNGHCRDNLFVSLDAGAGGLKVRGTGYTSKPNNIIDIYDRANGSPIWSVEPGGELTVRNNNGHNEQVRLSATTFANLQTPNNPSALVLITDSNTNATGEVIAGGGSFNVIGAFTGSDWRVVAALADKTTLVSTKNKTGNYTVLASESGTHFFNPSATGMITYTLPAGAAGLNYCFTAAAAAQTIRITATGSAKVSIGTSESATNGYIETNDPLSTACIIASGSARWITKSVTGEANWTVN